MNSRWHILIVDASDQGASQLFREIQCDGVDPACERAGTTQELLAALDRQVWDVILADDTTPPLDVPAIVALLAERRLDTPLIVASNSRDEERLVAYLRDGAADYLQRDRLARLRPAIERAIHDTLARRESRHVEALRQIESNYRMLMEQTTDAISIADAQGWYQEVNAAATNMLGYSRDELLHMQVSDLITPAGLAQEPVHFDALRRGQIVLSERQLRCKNGQLINVETSARMLSNGQILAITRDITGRQQAEADLRRYAAELEGRNEELGAFAHTVAHDLSNPLGLVIGYAESLIAYHDTMAVNERLSCLDAIVRGAQKMNNIINELLLLSGVRDMVVEVTSLDMASIVIEARQRLVDMIESTRAEILLPATWPVALGYEPWIEEVWANYLSNALKYAGRPPRLELGADPQPDQMVRFWIRDNGAGISPDAQARLFTPFTRLDRARAKGHGLGLSIVRRIVEKLGGQVGVESVVGQGSVFSFTLPAAST